MTPESRSSIVSEDIDAICDEALPWEALRDARVLVTGASGMLPMYVLRTLMRLNERFNLNIHIGALVRNESRAREVFGNELALPRVTFHVQDVADGIRFDTKYDHIVHGASPARPALHSANPVGTIRSNLVGTDNLLVSHVASASPGLFLTMSSSEVYGAQAENVHLISESSYGGIDLLSQRSCYPVGKQAAEALIVAYSVQYNFPFRLPRFGHVYGPGLRLSDGRVQADFARNVMEGHDIIMKSAGTAVRTYTYVSDAVSGLFYCWLRGQDGAYNVADPEGAVSIRGLAEAFVRVRSDLDLRVVHEAVADENLVNTERLLALDSGKLQKLGWMPRVELQTGVERMVAHLQEVIRL